MLSDFVVIMNIVLAACLLQVFCNPWAHTAGNSQNESFDGTTTTHPADQTTSQESLPTSAPASRVDVAERAAHNVDNSREGNMSDQYSGSAPAGGDDELSMPSEREEDGAIPPSTDTGVPSPSVVPLPSPSENAIDLQSSVNVVIPTPPVTNTGPPSSDVPEGGEEVLTFEEFKKRRELEMPKAPELESPPQLPLSKAKNNYASFECGARVIETNEEAQNPMAILTENKDAYMLNPCKANITFTVELCDTVRILKLEMGCFELFSSIPETFRVYSCERHPADGWNFIGEFNATNERILQSFVLKESVYAKFVKVEMVSHYGKEHYCPISVFRVIGASVVEELEYSEAHKTNPSSNEDESDEYLHLGEEQSPGNGRLLAVAKDAVLSLLEPFSRLGNGLIHKDSRADCKDSSCTPSDILPPPGQSALPEKLQDDTTPSPLETWPHKELSDAPTQAEQDPSVLRTSEHVQESNTVADSGDVLGEQDTFPGDTRANHHGNVTWFRTESGFVQDSADGIHSDRHSGTPATPHIVPSTTAGTQVPIATTYSGSHANLETQTPVETVKNEEDTPGTVLPFTDIETVGSFVPGGSLLPDVPLATPSPDSLERQEVTGTFKEGDIVKPDAADVTPSPSIAPDRDADYSHPLEGVALGPQSAGPSNPSTPLGTASILHSGYKSESTVRMGSQESAPLVQGPPPDGGMGTDLSTGDHATPTLNASTVAHTVVSVPSPSDTEVDATLPSCNNSTNAPLNEGDSPASSSSSPSVKSNLSLNSSQWVVGTGGGGAGVVQDHVSLPTPGSVSREKSVLLRLNDRVKNVEENVSLLSSYLDQVTNSLRKNKNKTDDVQRALDRNLQTLNEAILELNSTLVATVQRLKRMEDEMQSRSFDSVEAHLQSIGNTVLNQQMLLFTLSCLTAVLILLLVVLVIFLCLVRGCGQARGQGAGTVTPPLAAIVKSNVKKVHAINGGMILEDVAVSRMAQQSKIDTIQDPEIIGLLEKKKRKGKRNSH